MKQLTWSLDGKATLTESTNGRSFSSRVVAGGLDVPCNGSKSGPAMDLCAKQQNLARHTVRSEADPHETIPTRMTCPGSKWGCGRPEATSKLEYHAR